MQELRRDPVSGGWVIFAPGRATRPAHFDREEVPDNEPTCPFCPGPGENAHDVILEMPPEPHYPGSSFGLRVLPDAYPILKPDAPFERFGKGMYDLMTGYGHHELLIESPLHGDDIDTYAPAHMASILQVIRDRTEALQAEKGVAQILITRNRGIAAGAEIHHPHLHIQALPVVPKKVREEVLGSQAYYGFRDRCVYCDMVAQEIEDAKRVVVENEGFIAFCSYAARFPFEVTVVPRLHAPRFEAVTPAEVALLGDLLQDLVRKYKCVFTNPPLNYMLHTCPSPQYATRMLPEVEKYYHWHLEIIPKVTRVAGFEWGTGCYINPMLPEESARYLLDEGVGKD